MKDKHLQEIYEFSSFRLDLKKSRLLCGEEVIPLTPKEYDLLLYLVENVGRVVEKNELLEAVWKDTYVEEATLTRNISWLRKNSVNATEKTKKSSKPCRNAAIVFCPKSRTAANIQQSSKNT